MYCLYNNVGKPLEKETCLMKPLAGKVALVAGATRGAGRAIAIELGAAGATVYATGRTTRAQVSEYGACRRSRGAPLERAVALQRPACPSLRLHRSGRLAAGLLAIHCRKCWMRASRRMRKDIGSRAARLASTGGRGSLRPSRRKLPRHNGRSCLPDAAGTAGPNVAFPTTDRPFSMTFRLFV